MKANLQTFRRLLPLLPAKARPFLWTYVVFSSALAGLDIAALMLLAVSLTGMVNNQPITLPIIGTIEPSGFVWVLLVVCGLIILKSVIALTLQWVATRRFASYELEIGDRLFAAYIKAPWTERLRRNTSQLIRLADVGIASVVGGFMLPMLTLPAMLTTFVAVVAVLVIAQPVTAMITLVYLGLIACILYYIVARKSIEAGRVNRTYSFKVASLMTDMVNALKEITLRNSAPSVAKAVHDNRIHTTRARSNLNFLGQVPKFVFDGALVGGFLLVGGAAYLGSGGNIGAAFSAVALFGVAGYRLVPSLTGFQAVMTQTHANVPIVGDVIRDIEQSSEYVTYADTVGRQPIIGEPRELILRDVRFTYPHREQPALREVDLVLPMGSTLGSRVRRGRARRRSLTSSSGCSCRRRGAFVLTGSIWRTCSWTGVRASGMFRRTSHCSTEPSPRTSRSPGAPMWIERRYVRRLSGRNCGTPSRSVPAGWMHRSETAAWRSLADRGSASASLALSTATRLCSSWTRPRARSTPRPSRMSRSRSATCVAR